jgi:hypothetical protein
MRLNPPRLKVTDPDLQRFLGNVAESGVWFIWGAAGSCKTSFAMRVMRDLCHSYSVLYDSLEQRANAAVRDSFLQAGLTDTEVHGRLHLLPGEPMELLTRRLKKRRAPHVVVIDSWQYTGWESFYDYYDFRQQHPDKLLIVICQAQGNEPASKPAIRARFDSDERFFLREGRAVHKGRSVFDTYYDVNPWAIASSPFWASKETTTEP